MRKTKNALRMNHLSAKPFKWEKFCFFNWWPSHHGIFYFSEKVAQLRELKLNDIIIDPGFGFAKDTAQNFELMNHLSELNALELPMLVGISRKSMIYKTLDLQPQEALNGTTFLNTVSLLAGTKILRVHDVKEAVETVSLYQALKAESL